MPGVVRTRVGYAGGTTRNPTYANIGDHSETIQIEYDPSQVSYEELLDVFWSSHRPTQPSWSKQYASIIFYHNEEQRRLAEETKERQADRLQSQIYTDIVPVGDFTLAEAYHQKYRLRQTRTFAQEFSAIYPDDGDFVDSTAAARVNGYLGGNGSCEQLRSEVEGLGLSPEGRERLLGMVCR